MSAEEVCGSMGSNAVGSEHGVRLFDVPESLGEAVAGFLLAALADGAPMLLAAKPVNVTIIAEALAARGLSLSELIERQLLTVVDAETTLCQFMRHGMPDPVLFEQHVAATVRRLAAGASRVAVYGEMVEILAAEENFRAAAALEQLWNQLASGTRVSLLCGYSSAHFATPDKADALHAICASHSQVLRGDTDLLGNWLIESRQQRLVFTSGHLAIG